MVSKYLFETFINCKGESSNLIVEKPSKQYLSQVLTSTKAYGCHVPLDVTHWEEQSITSVAFLPKKLYNLKLIMRKEGWIRGSSGLCQPWGIKTRTNYKKQGKVGKVQRTKHNRTRVPLSWSFRAWNYHGKTLRCWALQYFLIRYQKQHAILSLIYDRSLWKLFCRNTIWFTYGSSELWSDTYFSLLIFPLVFTIPFPPTSSTTHLLNMIDSCIWIKTALHTALLSCLSTILFSFLSFYFFLSLLLSSFTSSPLSSLPPFLTPSRSFFLHFFFLI
jgi:hypothetical protein